MINEKTLGLFLWGVVAYAIVLLIYFTFLVFKHDANFVSAFGSILSGIATFYAAFIAIYLYNDWRKPAKFELKKEMLKDIQGILREKYSVIDFLNNEIIRRYQNQELYNRNPINKDYYPDFNIAFLASKLLFRFEEYSNLNNDNDFKLKYKNFIELLRSYHFHFPYILSINEEKNESIINYRCDIEYLDKKAFYTHYENNKQKQPDLSDATTKDIIYMLFDSYQELTSKILELLDPEKHN